MKHVKRRLKTLIEKRLQIFPAVYLMGPRQGGKTTLAKKLDGEYFDLQSDQDWNRLDFEWGEWMARNQLLILDEAQVRPEIFNRLRSEIDKKRKTNGRFLLLGSVSPNLISEVGESLAGRVSRLELAPFILDEIGKRSWKDLWFYGGYPDGGLLNHEMYFIWQKDYLESIASRDIPELGGGMRPSHALRLFSVLASAHGTTWNASSVGKSLGVTYHTINNYVDLLEEMFLVRRIPSYHPSSLKKRVSKASKFYWRDSGLLHSLYGFKTLEDLMNDRNMGLSFEGFVIEQVTGSLKANGVDFETFSFRTSDNYELDLIIKIGRKLLALEIKSTSSPSSSMIGRFIKTSELVKADEKIVICNTEKETHSQECNILNVPGALEYINGLC